MNGDPPVVQEPATWQMTVRYPRVAVLPVKHFTGQSDPNESGFMVAVDDVPIPTVIVGPLDDLDQLIGASDLPQTAPDILISLVFRGIGTLGGRIDYESAEAMILDGWRPD